MVAHKIDKDKIEYVKIQINKLLIKKKKIRFKQIKWVNAMHMLYIILAVIDLSTICIAERLI